MVAQGGQHMVVDVGGSHVTAAAVSTAAPGGAALLSRIERSVDSHASSAVVLDSWAAACVDAAEGAGIDPGGRDWGLAMPGPFDYDHGIGHYARVGKFERLAGVDIRSGLADRLGVEPARVRFVHDAGAYGIGEWRYGSPTRHARFVCVTLGTGVGSAFVDDGALVFDRADVPPGGEVHRLPFDGRDLEDTISTRALLARYASPDPGLSVKELASRARSGDARAQGAFDTGMEALALAVGPWLAAFGATALVVGGSISRSWDVLERGFRTGLSTSAPELAGTLDIAPSRLLADAPLYGVAHLLEQSAAGARCVTAPALP
ncbi:ROK family protein [Leifsonia aquatica]|uniref:ROK family protein n=1 Tax=Leifsonia aquatica TaxID=144185 RepID=UPI00381D5EBE